MTLPAEPSPPSASPRPAYAPPRPLRRFLSLHDFEAAARRRLPRPIFEYVAGSVEDRQAERDNRQAFSRYGFRTRVLVDVSSRRQDVELFGQRYASPVGIAPMGIAALTAYRGDIVLARAAQAANVPCIMSGSSLIRLEEVMDAAPGTWFQAYLPGDDSQIGALIDRVAAAGVQTLVLTVDTPVQANRENNVRAGFSTPLKPSLGLAYQGLSHPRWLLGTFLRTLVRHGMPHFENNYATRGAPILSKRVLRDFSDRGYLNWTHAAQIRRRWQGPMVIKGILGADDARRAREQGMDGIIVSNHGGRQLDGAPSTIRVLPEIVDAVGRQTAVFLDGGVNSGQNVLKAMALGAKGVFIGRAFLWGLGAGGEKGVTRALEILQREMDITLALCGERDVNNVGPHNIYMNELRHR